jgi:hypothetical protein
MSDYDPSEDIVTLLSNALADEPDVKILRIWEVRDIDLLSGDFALIRSQDVEDEFLGIGAREYRRNVFVQFQLRTAESRERLIQLAEKVRRYFRNSQNWRIGTRQLLNLFLTNRDLVEVERGIWSMDFEAQWFVIEAI